MTGTPAAPDGLTLGIDVGTGSTKAGLVDSDGTLVAVGRADHAVRSPAPDRAETNPTAWLRSIRAATRDALGGVAGGADAVRAVGLAGQMHGVVLSTHDGTPITNAVLWPDRRARALLGDYAARLDEAGVEPANPVTSGMAGPILAWFARHDPATLHRATHALQPKDWVRLRLTGSAATEPSDASATLLWDAPGDRWADLRAQELLVGRRDLLAELRAPQDVAGPLGPAGAELLGLPAGTPVVVGAADTAAALLGVGVRVGQAQVTTGTGGQICVVLDRAIVDTAGRTHLFRGAQSDNWYAMAAVQNVGVTLDWALGVLDADLDELAAAVANTAPGARGVTFLPWLTGERTPWMDDGLLGSWRGMSRATSRDHLLRAVAEGIAFALRDGLDALRAAGHVVDEALLAGGGSQSAWWRSLLSDALGVPLLPHDVADSSVRGAGVLAWRGLGAAVTVAAEPTGRVEPTDAHADAHEQWLAVTATEVDRAG